VNQYNAEKIEGSVFLVVNEVTAAGVCEYFSVFPTMFVVSPALSTRLSLHLRWASDPTNDRYYKIDSLFKLRLTPNLSGRK